MLIENTEIARLFREAADLLEIRDGNPFRVRAYRNAARVIEEQARPVAELLQEGEGGVDQIDELPGIGADLAGKIAEIVRTGTFPLLEELEQTVPKGATVLMQVPGIGPKRAGTLIDTLKITSLDELRDAAAAGKLDDLPGFGASFARKVLRELKARRHEERRMLRPVAAQYAESLLAYLREHPAVKRAEIAGSFRRLVETVGDVDILVACSDPEAVIEHFVAFPTMADVLEQGTTKAAILLRSGLRVDLRVLDEGNFGAGLHYFIGSKAHNIAVRKMGQARGLKINEYGVFRGRKRIAGRTEEEVLASVGLPWIPHELRENRGEIEAAQEGRLPDLVELAEIRGDLQCHSTDSDGHDSIRAMARAAQAMGYEYLAITDHSPALRVTGGMDRKGFLRQMKAIDRLNEKLDGFRVLKGAEVDILQDGSLDMDDDTLAAFDVVVVSLHSKLDLSRREQTRRIVRALSHPSADIFGHPSGRLIGRRRGAQFDFDEVVRVAVDNGVLLEVNAQPERLDMNDISCRAAVERGAKVVISTDAHSAETLGWMRWGVEQARRGWASGKDVANTLPLRKLLKLFHAGRR